MKRIIAIVLLIGLSLSAVSCHRIYTVKEAPTKIPNADEVKIDITPADIADATTPEGAINGLAVDIFKSLYTGDKNILVSPVSISLALGMTSGGAAGNTLTQFEKLLGRGVTMDEMNRYFSRLSEKLDESEMVDIEVANSIWISDNEHMISVKKSFKDFADEVYDADIFSEPFNDSTVKKINGWVDDNTDGMIKNIIDKIDPNTVMYLINALSFDGEWQRAYTDTSDNFKFTNVAGEIETVTGMFSSEAKYLEDENTTGFIKNYKGGDYGFAVLLPNSDININDYVSYLTGEKLSEILADQRQVSVVAKLPKFKYDFSANLNETLMQMGLTDAFNSSLADLSEIGESSMGNLYIGNVVHKTFIEVAEKGTKAAAVTAVEVNTESAPMPPKEQKYVTVDRPFVYAIIDNTSNLPIFLGAVLSVE